MVAFPEGLKLPGVILIPGRISSLGGNLQFLIIRCQALRRFVSAAVEHDGFVIGVGGNTELGVNDAGGAAHHAYLDIEQASLVQPGEQLQALLLQDVLRSFQSAEKSSLELRE